MTTLLAVRRWLRHSKAEKMHDQSEVTAWLQTVSEQLDENLEANAIERGVNLYRAKKPRTVDLTKPQPGTPAKDRRSSP